MADEQTDEEKASAFEAAVLAVMEKNKDKEAKPAKKPAKSKEDDDADDADDDDDDDDTDGKKKEPVKGGFFSGMADTEAAMEAAVRKAIEKIAKEEKTDKRLAALEAEKKKKEKETETAPKQVRKITALIWGKDAQDDSK